jgi:hypothetical protein
VPDFPAKLTAFRQRCETLRQDPAPIAGIGAKPAEAWFYL